MTNTLPLYERVMATATTIREKTQFTPVLGVILGSGLGALADAVEDAQVVSYDELPYVPKSTVKGHAGKFVCGTLDGVQVIVMSGRSHIYEGHSPADLTVGVRAMIELGAKTMVVTNAAGGIHTEFRPGDLMAILDHINMQGSNPLFGIHDERLGPHFLDMTLPYDRKLRRLMQKAASQLSITLHSGVYCGVLGPVYETPAEVRMLRSLGADAVGMSTVCEVIAARHAGARVVGLSLISNLAAGLEDTALSHDEVTATAERVAARTVALLRTFIPLAARDN